MQKTSAALGDIEGHSFWVTKASYTEKILNMLREVMNSVIKKFLFFRKDLYTYIYYGYNILIQI